MTTLHWYFDSVPQENRYRLDQPLDFDHNGVPEDLGKIASSVYQWEGRVADELKLTPTEVAAIKTKYSGELSLQTRAALQKWQEKFGPYATYRNLITVFVNAGKGSYAEAVCRVLGAKFDNSQQGHQGVFLDQGVEDDPQIGTSGSSLSCDPQPLSGDQGYRLHPSQGHTSADQRSSREPLNQFRNTGPQSYYQQTNSLPPFPTVNPGTQQPLVHENTNLNKRQLFKQCSQIQDGSYQPYQTVEHTSTDQRNLCESVNQFQSTGPRSYQQISLPPLCTVNPHTQHPRLAQRVPSSPHPYQLVNFPQMVEPHTHLQPLHYPNIPNPQIRSQTQDDSYQPSQTVEHTSTDQRNLRESVNQFQSTGPHTYYHPPPLHTASSQQQHPRLVQRVTSSPHPQIRSLTPNPHQCTPSSSVLVRSQVRPRVVPPACYESLGYPPVAQAVESNVRSRPRAVSGSTQPLGYHPVVQSRYLYASVNPHNLPYPLDHQFQGTNIPHYVDSLLIYDEAPSKRMRYNEQQTPPTPAIAQYADYLRGVYNSAKICSDKFPQVSCKQFINLALVKKEEISRSEADEFTKATLHGHIDEILKKKEPIEIEKILQPIDDQKHIKCVFVEGAPGVGKSTFCWEFCRRWDEIEALKKFKMVYLLRLRDKRVQETKTVSDLFYHENCKLSMDVASEVLQCEGRGVLLVLDGFDELPVSLRSRESSLFVRLIQGSCLSHCTVLVTSRPSATADLLKVAKPQINKQVELLGFTQERIEEYARSIFSSQADNMLADFLKYISVNPAIRSMMYIPLNSAIVVEVYRANKTTGSPIPHTMTQLYFELSIVLLKRHLGDPLAVDLPGLELIAPQNKLYKPLCALAKLAFEGMEREEVVFDKLPDGCDHFGFMNASSELYLGSKGKSSYSFLHLTLQEFLAAFHISQLPADEKKQLFDKYSPVKHSNFNVVWRFVAGLTGFKGIEDAWKVFENMKGNVDPFYIRCLYEAQKKVDCNSVFPESKVVSYNCYRMELFDYYALGYCVSASRCMWKLRMDTSGYDDGEIEMLSCQLHDRGENNIVSLSIDHCDDYYDYHDDDDVCRPTLLASLTQLIPKLVKLNEFIIDSYDEEFLCYFSSGAFVELVNALSKLTYLHTLVVKTDRPDSDDRTSVLKLSDLIEKSKSLKIIILKLCFYRWKSFTCLAKAVFSSSSLNEVEIETEWDWSSGINPFTPLEDNHNIKQLTLLELKSPLNLLKLIPDLAKALHKNTALTSLCIEERFNEDDVDIVDLPTTSVTALSEMIKVNHTLKQLAIQFRCGMVTRDDILTLNKALQHNTTLKQLELRYIDVKDCSDLAKLNELDPRISNNIKNYGLWPNVYFEDDSEQEEDKEEA